MEKHTILGDPGSGKPRGLVSPVHEWQDFGAVFLISDGFWRWYMMRHGKILSEKVGLPLVFWMVSN